MLCQYCKKNTATINYVGMINGVKFESHLCKECYAIYGDALNSKSSGDILADFFGMNPIAHKICPVCGTKFSDYERTGLLGCASCYDIFKEELMPHIQRIQGKTNHIGKAAENTDELGLHRQLKDLQEQLEKALREHRYNDANRLNREIYKISKTLFGGDENNG